MLSRDHDVEERQASTFYKPWTAAIAGVAGLVFCGTLTYCLVVEQWTLNKAMSLVPIVTIIVVIAFMGVLKMFVPADYFKGRVSYVAECGTVLSITVDCVQHLNQRRLRLARLQTEYFQEAPIKPQRPIRLEVLASMPPRLDESLGVTQRVIMVSRPLQKTDVPKHGDVIVCRRRCGDARSLAQIVRRCAA